MLLKGLFGNKSVERILLFLLVNEKVYASQVHRLLNTPLTPIQKALERLEQGGILRSLMEGKTRFFEFNPSYPLRDELENLLKKAYALLPPHDKRQYFYIRHAPEKRRSNQTLILEAWKLLRKVSRVDFQFKSRQSEGFGEGKVEREDDEDRVLIFHEKGSWSSPDGRAFVFRNVFRWTLARVDEMLTLEHLRFGKENPVFLYHLVPTGPYVLESLHAHLCGQDTYFGRLRLEGEALRLTWRIIGPKKNEEVQYVYR